MKYIIIIFGISYNYVFFKDVTIALIQKKVQGNLCTSNIRFHPDILNIEIIFRGLSRCFENGTFDTILGTFLPFWESK
jgi:hypothetical protein